MTRSVQEVSIKFTSLTIPTKANVILSLNEAMGMRRRLEH